MANTTLARLITASGSDAPVAHPYLRSIAWLGRTGRFATGADDGNVIIWATDGISMKSFSRSTASCSISGVPSTRMATCLISSCNRAGTRKPPSVAASGG